jgi:hypothetical protein
VLSGEGLQRAEEKALQLSSGQSKRKRGEEDEDDGGDKSKYGDEGASEGDESGVGIEEGGMAIYEVAKKAVEEDEVEAVEESDEGQASKEGTPVKKPRME